MDPISQGVIGAVAAQQATNSQSTIHSRLGIATLLGILSGMAPDLDILIRSEADSLFSLEYHRHFTHSLFFIPVGSLICALFFYTLLGKTTWFRNRNRNIGFKHVYLYCALGYGSHGLLDACTTYGTQLLWPFSDVRVAWDTISIIDPLFTIPLLLLITLAVLLKQKYFSYLALGWVFIYISFGIIQRERAEAIGLELAISRGHSPIEINAKPSFANLLVWKIVYRTKERVEDSTGKNTEDYFYVDAVKIGLEHYIFEGSRIARLNIDRDFPWLDKQSQQAKDIERFRWFSNGYIARSPYYENRIIDIRYSLLPNEVKGLWGIELSPEKNADAHADYVTGDRSKRKEAINTLWKMVTMSKD